MKLHSIIIAAAAALALASCSDRKGWTVEGNVAGAPDSTLYVEASTFNNWRAIDTLKLSGSGDFKFRAKEAAEIPSIYRLRFGDKYIYFPVDSIETVTIQTNAKHFDQGFTVSGNATAPMMAMVDSLVSASVAKNGAQGALRDQELKNRLNVLVNQDSTCLLSYYIVGKTVGAQPLYDYRNRHDVRVMANAANNYLRFRPNDPRAKELEQRWIAARRANGTLASRPVEVQAEVSARPTADLARFDRNGKKHNFDDVVGHGHVTILNFTRYDGEASPANTVALKKAWDQYRASGLQIFQVAYDPDEISWKRSAANMPWIAVYNAPTDNVEALIAYNVDPINGAPVSFVFNGQGELIARVVNPNELPQAIAKAQ